MQRYVYNFTIYKTISTTFILTHFVVGCRIHSNCPFDKACVNGFCQSPCNIGGMCGVNTICRSENHQGQCSCVPGYTGDPLRQCTKIYAECETDLDCGRGYVCAQQVCKGIF